MIMKKLLLLLAMASFGIAGNATAQKKGKKNADHNKNYGKKHEHRNHDDHNQNVNYNDRYSKNTPRKVRDAFYRDYPNASNVSWTKDRGVWTANFKRSGIFGGNSSVSYAANGQRVNAGNNNIFGRRDRTVKNTPPKNSRSRDWY
jgi:Ni/Co efflux regulator RcnB